MTDHTDLLRQLRGRAAKYGDGGVNEEIDVRAADAIEALQNLPAYKMFMDLAEMKKRAEKAEADNAALKQENSVLYRFARLDGHGALEIDNAVKAAMREGKDK